jgi:hypothetical protein
VARHISEHFEKFSAALKIVKLHEKLIIQYPLRSYMKIYIAIILGILLLAVVGCTPEQEAQARELIGQHRCAAFNGYLCSAPDDCVVPYLDTIESYCCPLQCNTCNQSCEDNNPCTIDSCSKKTNYTCMYKSKSDDCFNETAICKEGILIDCIDDDPCTIDKCPRWQSEWAAGEELVCSHQHMRPCPGHEICGDGVCSSPTENFLDCKEDCPISWENEEIWNRYLNTIGIKVGDNKPQIDFFVMSLCPAGRDAEEAISKVYVLLKGKADFNPHYVWYSKYFDESCLDAEKQYCSMHGVQEAHQNIRELCVAKYMGLETFFAFEKAINSHNTLEVDTYWESVATELGIDTQKVKDCYNNEAIELAKSDKEIGDKMDATGSPTIVIDGKIYSGTRTPAGFQEALCAEFDTPPSECSEVLEGYDTAAASGGAGA